MFGMGTGNGKKYRFWHRHWHGLIQILVSIVFVAVCVIAFLHMKVWNLAAPDMLLLIFTGAAVTVAIICSHAYNHIPGDEDLLYEQAARLRAVWLHANFCWKTISIWMTVIPLYCTCVAIYLSGTPEGDEFDHIRILVYSVLSLVISLGVYAIRPSNRASAYRKAYRVIDKALIDYQESMSGSAERKEEKIAVDDEEAGNREAQDRCVDQNVRSNLAKAMKKGERFITKQDIQDPK